MCVTMYMVLYGLTTNTIAHSHCVCTLTLVFLTLRRGNQINIDIESEREKDCTQRFIKDKYTLFILQEVLYFSGIDVLIIKMLQVSVRSRIAYIFSVMCY